MDLAALVRAVEVLMSPLEWGSQDAWLAESQRRVRDVLGVPASAAQPATLGGLQELLRLPGDEDHFPVASLRRALAAGLATLQRLHAWTSTLGQAFDDMNTGMAVFRNEGLRDVARNARWDQLLDEEPERDRLLELITRQARHAASGGCPGEDDGELELSGGSYRVVTSPATAGTLLPEAAVLVLMDRLSPGLPTTQELRITFGLRGREPQVALLAAEGLSNADIALRLRLSAHTVRHYLERVLDRLGLHSRKALALRLMASSGERPRPPA